MDGLNNQQEEQQTCLDPAYHSFLQSGRGPQGGIMIHERDHAPF